MSFFKKMVDKFEDLVTDDDKKKSEKKKEEEHHEGTKDLNPQYSQPAPYSQQSPYGQAPSQYGHEQQPFQPPPQGGPPLPPGWVSKYDPNSQRYYFLEEATGRTQWEPPQQSMGGYGPPPGGPPVSGQGYQNQGQYGAPGGYYSQETHQSIDGQGNKEIYEKKEKKEGGGKGGMLAAGAGGLAVGAVGGALVGHAMGDDSSDDENHAQQPVYAQQPTYVQETTYYQEPAPPPMAPPPGSDHSSVSSSDKEDLEEAREDYENASDASDREEAREEYQEQYEETYGDD